ncbi:hypothetical protein ACIBCM_00470 [Streptomyces sp. NPDC051018]|uniref:hypothetical protein n=1 Tax=Streptomyces sp. NPDC051018 TaxID=3365639 RepID=UPI0037BC6AEA
MTEPEHLRESPPLDTTAQLLSRITAQLGTQLSSVRRDGTRRRPAPADPRPGRPAPPPPGGGN